MIIKATKEYLDILNKAVAREIQVSAQYLLQHTKMEKISRKVIPENILMGEITTYGQIGEKLKEIGIEEMKHLGAIMQRIFMLDGEATTKPSKIIVGDSLKEFAEINYEAEDDALGMYRDIIKMAEELGDIETKLMFEHIYSDEEKHLLFFNDLLKIEDEPDVPEAKDAEWLTIFDDDYIALLNKAAAAEFSAIVQYTTQHEKTAISKLRMKKSALEVITDSNKASVISAMLKPIFRQEMDHLELILERVYEVGKEAIADVDPIPKVGKTVEDFITLDREAENTAILLYRKIINKAAELGDIKTKKMFEDILVEEEDHYFQFDDYL